jgi:hypothetical protein
VPDLPETNEEADRVNEWWEELNAQTHRREARWATAARILSNSLICAALLYAWYLVLFR